MILGIVEAGALTVRVTYTMISSHTVCADVSNAHDGGEQGQQALLGLVELFLGVRLEMERRDARALVGGRIDFDLELGRDLSDDLAQRGWLAVLASVRQVDHRQIERLRNHGLGHGLETRRSTPGGSGRTVGGGSWRERGEGGLGVGVECAV